MITPEKIEEWLKEVEARPASAAPILKIIANRLRELAERNEELQAENLALQTGQRVEEYEKRIAHLQYQLDLVKRRFGADFGSAEAIQAESTPGAPGLLLYDERGRFLRLDLPHDGLDNLSTLGRITGEMQGARLLAVPPGETLLFTFTSGRVSALTLDEVPASRLDQVWDWEQAGVPSEPHAGERLACVTPLSSLPLSDFIVQVSRRGCTKKIPSTMAESVLDGRFIGKGVNQKADQPFEVNLCKKDDRLALVTWEGWLACLDVEPLSYAIEESLKLSASDYLTAAFVLRPGDDLLVMTQAGKLIHWTEANLEPAGTARSRGQALFSPARREQGVRVVGAAALRAGDFAAILHSDGGLSLHRVSALSGAGRIETDGDLLAFAGVRFQESKAS